MHRAVVRVLRPGRDIEMQTAAPVGTTADPAP
jgi:hypothetical protein